MGSCCLTSKKATLLVTMLPTTALLFFLHAPTAFALVPTRLFPTCLTSPLDLVADPEDCHIFYQCDLNPQPMTCGDMMFNSFRQICDWPTTVLQVRPECRQEEQLRFTTHEHPQYRQRTLRMLSLFGDGDRFSQKRLRAPQDIGLGRKKLVGNREYFGEDAENRVEPVEYEYMDDVEEEVSDNYEKEIYHDYQEEVVNDYEEEVRDDYEYETKNVDSENEESENVEDSSIINFEQVLEEITKQLSLKVQSSISQFQDTADTQDDQYHEAQADSEPADTIRLQPQTPTYLYEKVYPSQVPAPRPVQIFQQSIPNTPAQTIRIQHRPQQHGYNQVSPAYQNQPQPATILVEDTREYKPVWTVTRERPQQILVKHRNIKYHQQKPCGARACGKQRHRVLRKVKRKLIEEERNTLEDRRNELNQEAVDVTPRETIEAVVEEVHNTEEDRAITLKEAYDRAIRKVDQITQDEEQVRGGNLLNEILNRDFGEYSSHNYVNSDYIRSDSLLQ